MCFKDIILILFHFKSHQEPRDRGIRKEKNTTNLHWGCVIALNILSLLVD